MEDELILDGWSIVPPKEGKSKDCELLISIGEKRNSAKFNSVAVEALKLKPVNGITQTVNFSTVNSKSYIVVFNSTDTGEENTAKKQLTNNYKVNITKEEAKGIFTACNLVKEDETANLIDTIFILEPKELKDRTVFILKPTEKVITKSVKSNEQIIKSESLKEKNKALHVRFKKIVEKTGMKFSKENKYMQGFQTWKKSLK